MTNSLSEETIPRNAGVYQFVEAKVDITSLDSAGTEPWNPNDQLDHVNDYDRVIVVDQEDQAKIIRYDEDNDQFVVKTVNDTGDGSGGVADVSNNTDVGTVTVEIRFRR